MILAEIWGQLAILATLVGFSALLWFFRAQGVGPFRQARNNLLFERASENAREIARQAQNAILSGKHNVTSHAVPLTRPIWARPGWLLLVATSVLISLVSVYGAIEERALPREGACYSMVQLRPSLLGRTYAVMTDQVSCGSLSSRVQINTIRTRDRELDCSGDGHIKSIIGRRQYCWTVSLAVGWCFPAFQTQDELTFGSIYLIRLCSKGLPDAEEILAQEGVADTWLEQIVSINETDECTGEYYEPGWIDVALCTQRYP